MGYLSPVHNLNKVLASSLLYCVQYCVIFVRDILRVYGISGRATREGLVTNARVSELDYH